VIGCGTRRAKEATMPMRLSISQRKAFVAAMGKFTRGASGWVPAYNPNLNARMRLGSEVGKWLEADGGVPAKCNCWEAILIAGFNAGLWGTDYVKAAVGVTAVDVGLNLRRLVCFMSCVVRTKDNKGFAGQIVMIGDEGQHFALSTGQGHVLELDAGRSGLIALGKVLEISPYNNKTNEVYISDPPTLEELSQY
jgi:hypothetical protein